MDTVLWWLPFVILTLWSSQGVLMYLRYDWKRLVHFVSWNIAGRSAVCSISDFNEGEFLPSSNKIRVKETAVFMDQYGAAPDPHLWGALNCLWHHYGQSAHGTIIFEPCGIDDRLFVPYVSPGLMSFEEQAAFFIQPEDVGEFICRKKQQNYEKDFRFAFVDFLVHRPVISIIGWLICVLVVVFFCTAYFSGEARHNQFIGTMSTVYVTKAGGQVEVVRATRNKQVLTDDDENHQTFLLTKGIAIRVFQFSGGFSCVYVKTNKRTDVCFFAPATTRVGETLYVRRGSFAESTSVDGETTPFRTDRHQWLIPEDEARALVATGKFAIDDKP